VTRFAEGLTIVRADEVAPQPWKNGGGVTRELLRIGSPRSGDWLLRVSLADIEADGPFSAFAGMTRWFAVLAGGGVALRWPDRDADTLVTMRSAPLDLNVMARASAATANLARAAIEAPVDSAGWDAFGVFTLRPLVLERAGQPVALPARTLAWQDRADKAAWSLVLPPDAYETIAQAADGAPPAYWIGLRRHPRGTPVR
jgi:environmental stress-induced protein Ves